MGASRDLSRKAFEFRIIVLFAAALIIGPLFVSALSLMHPMRQAERGRDSTLLTGGCPAWASVSCPVKHDVYVSVKRSKLTHTTIGCGGFIPETEDLQSKALSQTFEKDEELTDEESREHGQHKVRRKKRRQLVSDPTDEPPPEEMEEQIPRAPDQETPVCDHCGRRFEASFLRKHFDVDVCDSCRDPKGIHTLVTKSTAKDRYLLNDVDLDVAERALSLWGSEEALEAERKRRTERIETSKLKQYNKKLKELKVQTRSSLYMKTTKMHEHTFGPETYDAEQDVYTKRCTQCEYTTTFEKL
ncbi:unnamed protein product [Echinostoma caproni]|uniref:XPA_C domain-containing protein n=1 Tax=Echinostoma caproni TaxID=27848 RepID=A0A183B5P2_9TREM|nr:unnamed protein product [Echinostoma caproni]